MQVYNREYTTLRNKVLAELMGERFEVRVYDVLDSTKGDEVAQLYIYRYLSGPRTLQFGSLYYLSQGRIQCSSSCRLC